MVNQINVWLRTTQMNLAEEHLLGMSCATSTTKYNSETTTTRDGDRSSIKSKIDLLVKKDRFFRSIFYLESRSINRKFMEDRNFDLFFPITLFMFLFI